MTFGNIKLVLDGPTARVTLARPNKLNPLDWATIQELRHALKQIEAKSEVTFAVITGEGRSFSAGGDLEAYVHLYRQPAEFAAFLSDFYDLLTAMESSEKIFIAAVNGICVAGGMELLLACDLALAADTAKLGDCHLNFGQLPGAGGSQRLPRAIGLLRAKHLMMIGDLLSAAEAEKIGLVGGVVPADDLDNAVNRLIAKMSAKSRAGLRGIKHLANLTLQHDLDAGLKAEIAFVRHYVTTELDAVEGLTAFANKRDPVFSS